MSYPELIQTKNFSEVQRMLKAYSPVPFHFISQWTGYPKWGLLVQLIQDFPYAKNKYRQTDDAYTCAQISTQFRNWVQANVYGLCFGIATGDTTPIDPGGNHVFNWTICDGKLVFVDYRGTTPAYAVPHTQYWVMEANLIKEFRVVDGWHL